jgi:hypothetical protein
MLPGVSVLRDRWKMRFEPPRFAANCAAALSCCAGLLTLAIGVSAQSDTPDAPVPTRSALTVAGVVVNSVTGEPIRRALVQVANLSVGSPAMLTDTEGRFQFADLPEAEIALAVRKPGFFNEQELHPESARPPMFFHVGANTPSIVLKLVPEATMSGRVLTVKGEPLEDVPVRVLAQRIFEGRKRWEQRGQASTDEDGQFRIANLAPGLYLLAAGPSFGAVGVRPVRAGTPREESIAAMFYPGVHELESATPITISAGQQALADLALKPEPLFKVSGTIVGLAPGMGSAPQFITKSGEPVTSPITFDAQTGKFDAKVPAGSYLLMVRTPDQSGAVLAADLPLVVNSDVAGVTLALGPPISLPISVEVRHTATSAPPEQTGMEQVVERRPLEQDVGSSATSVQRRSLTQVRLISIETRLELQEFQADDQNTVLAVRNITPGKYSFELSANPPWYVQSARCGTTDVLREDLAFPPGRRPEPLEVVLRDDGARLSGSVLSDHQPAAGAVLLIPDQGSLNQTRLFQSSHAGQYQFDSLPPGDYRLLAFDTVEGLEFRNPEALASYLSRAARVTLSPNEQASVSVELIQTGK